MSKIMICLHILRLNKIKYLLLANDLSLRENIDLLAKYEGYPLLYINYYIVDETGKIFFNTDVAVHTLNLQNHMTLYLY